MSSSGVKWAVRRSAASLDRSMEDKGGQDVGFAGPVMGIFFKAVGNRIAVSSCLIAEAQALKNALKQAVVAGWTRVLVESDSAILIQSILSFSSVDMS